MLEKARQSMEAGATGLIFGRDVWRRQHDESLRFVGNSTRSWPDIHRDGVAPRGGRDATLAGRS